MSKTAIPWSDGTKDNLYIDLTPLITGGKALITSDVNNVKKVRVKTITLTSGMEDVVHNAIIIHIEQDMFSLVSVTYDLHASVYEQSKAGYQY